MYQVNNYDYIFTDGFLPSQPSSLLLFNDRAEPAIVKGIESQVKAGDYFANLAKVLDLAGQIMEQNYQGNMELIKRLKKDLVYLQGNYKIVRKR